jgi:hypothetical protein
MILNLEKLAARQAFTHPESSWWLRPSAEIPLETSETTRASQPFGQFASVFRN